MNIREFQKTCERSYDILEKFFKTSTELTTSAIIPVRLISYLREPNFSDFEFLNIDYVEDNVEYDSKVEVCHNNFQRIKMFSTTRRKLLQVEAVDESIVLADEIEIDEPTEDCRSENELISNNVEHSDENSSCKSTDSTHDESDNIECNICGKLYKRKAHLLRHLMSHKGQSKDDGTSYRKRNYISVCNKCGKRFSNSKALQNHENEGECIEQEVRRSNLF